MATAEDIELLNAKLLSDKAKVREEGIRDLNSYLDALGGVGLRPLLDRQTSLFSQEDRMPSSTWPAVVRALCHCISTEIVSSKKRGPKAILAKTFRSLIQKAEDRSRPGSSRFLFRAAKSLFRHILEVILEVPSFVSDYSHVLRQLLMVSEYRSHMSKKVHSSLVCFYMDKIKGLVHDNQLEASFSKEEAFRVATTLECLLQNPPGDFSDELRESIAHGLSELFLHLRDEGRVAKKLLASLNVFLITDGPNLGNLVIELHSGIKDFMTRTWLTTRDRELKDGLILYGKLQLKLKTVIICVESGFIQQILPLLEKELDQSSTFSSGYYRFDGGREERIGNVSRGLQGFLELAASVLFEAGMSPGLKGLVSLKKQKKEDVFAMVNDHIDKGNCLWYGVFCFLIRHHHRHISKLILYRWLNTVKHTLERNLGEAAKTHNFEALVWILRCLQELSAVWPSVTCRNNGETFPILRGQFDDNWESIWGLILQWLPLFSSIAIIVEESFKLLSYLLVQSLLPIYPVNQDVWSLKPFTEAPSGSLLFFVAAFFSTSLEQVAACENFELRRNLLKWALPSPEIQDHLLLRCAAILALTVGCVPHLLRPSTKNTVAFSLCEELEDWAKPEDWYKVVEEDFDWSEMFLSDYKSQEVSKDCMKMEVRSSLMSFPMSQSLLKELADSIVKTTFEENHQHSLDQSIKFSLVIMKCMNGVLHTLQQRGQDLQDWSISGRVWQGLINSINNSADIIHSYTKDSANSQSKMALASWWQCRSKLVTSETAKYLKMLLACNSDNTSIEYDEMERLLGSSGPLLCALENLLLSVLGLLQSTCELVETVSQSSEDVSASPASAVFLEDESNQEKSMSIAILDADFDTAKETVGGGILGESACSTNTKAYLNNEQQWKLNCVTIIGAFAQHFPEKTCTALLNLLKVEKDVKVHKQILLTACKSVNQSFQNHIISLVDAMSSLLQSSQDVEADGLFVLTAVDKLMESVVESKTIAESDSSYKLGDEAKQSLSEQVLKQLADLLVGVTEKAFTFWHSRRRFAEAVTKLVSLDPSSANVLIDKYLGLLHDGDYRVRWSLSKNVSILFQAWTGHEELFQDICVNFGLQLVMATKERVVTAAEVSLSTRRDRCLAETAVMTLGELAAASRDVEVEAVFMICGNAAIMPSLRMWARSVLERLARRLNYPNRWKYLGHLLGSILILWVKVGLPLPALVEIRELLVCKSEPVEFLTYCCSMVLPSLFLFDCDNEMTWLANVMSKPVPALVKEHFAEIFAAFLPMYCNGSDVEKEKAVNILQGKMLAIAHLSEDERDQLIKKNMVSIVNCILQSCSSAKNPQFPLFSQEAVITAVQMVVDGFCESETTKSGDGDDSEGVEDRMQVFRPDRVFMFILQIHLQINSAFNARHRRLKLAGLSCLIDVIKHRVAVPLTCRYLFHTILQSMDMDELHEEGCHIIRKMLKIFYALPLDVSSQVLGGQLQLLVSQLLFTCVNLYDQEGEFSTSPVLALLEELILHQSPPFHQFIKELMPFPKLPIFAKICAFHSNLCDSSTFVRYLPKFVMQASEMPPFQLSRSLHNFHRIYKCVKEAASASKMKDLQLYGEKPEEMSALWRLVQLCFECSSSDMNDLAGDLLAKMGIGDPHAVAFALPGHGGVEATLYPSFSRGCAECVSIDPDAGVSDGFIIFVLLQLKNYLFDEDVLVIELTSQTLKGLLSMERGQRALKKMRKKESMYIDVFSRGVNPKVVEEMLNTVRAESTKKTLPLEDDKLWEVTGKPYDTWICSLVYSLIHYSEDTILRLCQGLVHCKSLLAEAFLPHVLGSLASRATMGSNICKLISAQVEKHVFRGNNGTVRSIQLFLNALNELRRCNVLTNGRRSEEAERVDKSLKVYWLQLDYLQTARVAQKCGAYFTSLMYVEHWCEENFGSLTLGEPDFSDDDELSEHVGLLLAVYTHINEPDGVYGVVRTPKLIPQLMIHEHEGKWSRAIESYDLLLQSNNFSAAGTLTHSTNELCTGGSGEVSIKNVRNFSPQWKYNKGLMRSLQQTGCDHVLKMYCQGLAAEKEHFDRDPEFQELQYESAWRAGRWDFYSAAPMSKSSLGDSHELYEKTSFHANLHGCLRSLKEGDAEFFFARLDVAKQELVKLISLSSLESTGNIYPSIVKLQILDCLSKSWGLRWRIKRNQNEVGQNLLGPYIPTSDQVVMLDAEWQWRLKQMQLHYDLLGPFVAFRKVLYQVLECGDHVPQQLLEFATLARKGGRINQAGAAVFELKNYYKTIKKSQDDLVGLNRLGMAGKVEEAKLLWAQGQHGMAVNLLKYVINHYNIEEDSANLYCLTGKWLAETRSDSSRVILEQYLQKAVTLCETGETEQVKTVIKRNSRAYYRLAHYADSLYRSYDERLTSSEAQAAHHLRQYKAKELNVLTKTFRSKLKDDKKGPSRKGLQAIAQEEKQDFVRKIYELQKQLYMDTEEAQRLQHDRDTFLQTALNSYRLCLTMGDKYDLRVVFRLTSLWFQLSSNVEVVKSMLETVNQVKSFKFLPLVYQIASRLSVLTVSQDPPSFQYALTCLVKKMALEHPYHTIYQLFALANGDRVKDKQRNKTAFVVDLDKKQAAEDLLNALMSSKRELVEQMRQMVEIYIRLAELEVKREDINKKLTLPRDIRSIRELELVPIITAHIAVDPSSSYKAGDFPYFKGLSDHIVIMNGINAPKVVECFGSDGRKYRQLAKSGNDDLRQDAVMEQLFGLVNTLLQHHPDTHKRRLGIRTYKVVPFTPSAGVLEWVNGTVPLGEYLLGSNRKGGAHARYGIGDWTFPVCRQHMDETTDKHAAFQTVCHHFRPVFHFFFLEKFSQPSEWFEKRLAYTRSVATSSMVGYIVGLGDRHSMNILIDQETAEVVHIDLGVAFEQGLMLKMPERVPFRLTRDIVDGMGVTGVEGVFRRSCEETLLVMRMNKDALLTIIEVFIHDPLYKWALSPLKALQRQKDTNETGEASEDSDELENFRDVIEANKEVKEGNREGNKDATRALMRVKQKLDGYEGGDMKSIQGQVQQLIQDAQDPDKLCQMFSGWGAWL